MIFGAHVVIHSKDAAADRAFFRDVLGFASVDAGHGWLIFALPPAEAAFHPVGDGNAHELYLMCDDLNAEIQALMGKGVACSEVQEQRWAPSLKLSFPVEPMLVSTSRNIQPPWACAQTDARHSQFVYAD